MTKPHINDSLLFKALARDIGGYKALTVTCKVLKELNNGK